MHCIALLRITGVVRPTVGAEAKRQRSRFKKRETEGNAGDTKERAEDFIVKDKDRPLYVAHPKLNTALNDFIPSDSLIYQKDLAFDWDELRMKIEIAQAAMFRKRIAKAIQFLRSRGEYV